jgi:response regulator of citrate/malate metabolism
MRIKNMSTIREVLYQHTKKNSSRSIARAFNMSNTTVKKYIKIAKSHGYKNNINDDELQNLDTGAFYIADDKKE